MKQTPDRARKRFPWLRTILIVLATLIVVLGLLIGLWSISRSRDYQLFGKLVNRVETDEKVVALTFDDGPTSKFTHQILAVLHDKDVVATFFLIGNEAKANIAEVRAIAAAGHEIGNHTYTHPDMTLADESKAAEEVEKTDAAIRAAGYQGDILFRPPFGKKLFGLPLYLAKHDRTTITWDVEPESYDDIATDPQKITAHVLEKAGPGSIIILHVMYDSREASREALPHIIDGLKQRGFRFVTVSDLMKLRKT